MTSPHRTIANAVKSVATSWAATNWDTATCAVGYHLERLNQILGDDSPIVIGVIPTSVDDQVDRATRQHDEDLITISVVVMARMKNLDDDTITEHDTNTSALRTQLRKLQEITVGSATAERESTKLFTVFDHDKLSDEVWASLILCEYSLDSGPVGRVTA